MIVITRVGKLLLASHAWSSGVVATFVWLILVTQEADQERETGQSFAATGFWMVLQENTAGRPEPSWESWVSQEGRREKAGLKHLPVVSRERVARQGRQAEDGPLCVGVVLLLSSGSLGPLEHMV